MRRAFVGFSAPIGYDYKNSSCHPEHGNKIPNPIIYGATGLITLYDEIWFPTLDICPATMRDLTYVKFIDRDAPKLNLEKQGFLDDISSILEEQAEEPNLNLNNMFDSGFSDGIQTYAGFSDGVDNHTHGIDFCGVNFAANITKRELIADVWLVSRFKDLEFDVVLNPLTSKISGYAKAFGRDAKPADLKAIELTESVISITSMYDVVGRNGPYHEVLEELREDELIGHFRQWIDGERFQWDNRSIREIESDVNSRIREWTHSTLRAAVKPDSLSNIAADVTTDGIIGAVLGPVFSALKRIGDGCTKNQYSADHSWKAFVALGRDSVEQLKN